MAKVNLLSARAVGTRGDGWHADGGNLYLRVSDGGKRRRWVFRYVRGSKTTEIGLGGADTVSLKAAREMRQRIADDLAKGVDVRAERQRAAEAKTFADVAKVVIARDREHWGASSLDTWERAVFKHAESLGGLSVASVSIEDIKRVVVPMADRGDHVAARRTLRCIEGVLACAIANGWRERANVAAWEVFKEIMPKRPKADRRHKMVPWREAPAAFAKMQETDSVPAACLQLIALTGVRATEGAAARWSEIDFEEATFTIPPERMKMRDGHVVPLCRQALDLLRELKDHATGAYVFPGRGGPIGRAILWKVGKELTGASVHGLRATFRSWAADTGVPREVAESALAHTLGGVEAAYNRAAMVERRRKVMQAWGAFLAGEMSAAVVQFRR